MGDMSEPGDMAARDAGSVDLSVPDLSSPTGADLGKPGADLASLSLSGGGGCAVAGRAAPSPWAALAFALLLAMGVRRRRTQ
jgi:MYXO-CTERM domain-containing protein